MGERVKYAATLMAALDCGTIANFRYFRGLASTAPL